VSISIPDLHAAPHVRTLSARSRHLAGGVIGVTTDNARGRTSVRHTYLVCYDISNDLRLRRVHKTMVGFGDRLQYSVFECRFSPTDLARCRHALEKLIHHREDQVLFVNLGPVEGRGERVITAIGRRYTSIDSPCIIVDRETDAGEVTGTKRRIEALGRARQRGRDAEGEEEE
jgi:CRISPR-associated protein Cas2